MFAEVCRVQEGVLAGLGIGVVVGLLCLGWN